jgi:N-acetylglucosaminyldiphosphoundecaprenol N-acetyl-beta-D-mannosaminyltransferase
MTSHTTSASLSIRDLRLLNLGLEEAVAAIETAVLRAEPARVAFVNADCVNIAARDAGYRRDLATMDWVFVDGVGMRIAGRVLGQEVRDNVNGTDLFPLLCERLAAEGRSIFLLGGRPGVAAAAAAWAAAQYPGLVVAGTHHGYLEAGQNEQVAQQVRDAAADVLFVGLGAPRQEAWARRFGGAAGATVTPAVGGLFDYYAGRIPRAPAWLRRAGLEWLFRLYQEPGRLWRRYIIGNGAFLARIGWTKLTGAHKRPDAVE